MEELFKQWDLVLACVIAFNLFMMGLHSALGKIKDLTETKEDDKIYAVIGKIVSISQKIIDFLVGNKAH